MKVIVSHSQKQHAYKLAAALQKYNNLEKFFTSFFVRERSIFRKCSGCFSVCNLLIVKRSSVRIPGVKVVCTYLPEIIYQLRRQIKNVSPSFFYDRVHDFIVMIHLLFSRYDIFVSYERMAYLSFLVSKKKGKINVLDLATVHPMKIIEINNQYDGVVVGGGRSKFLNKEYKLKQREYGLADYMITLSEFAKQSYVRNGIDPEKIFVVNLGVDIELFSPKVNYDEQSFEILFVAGVRFLKGIRDLVEVFKRLNLPDSKLTIVGGGGDALAYVRSNVSENISYVTYLEHNELKLIYQRASVFVLPSYMDSWGQVVVEAMACGLPVIISDNTGSKDIVEPGYNGFVIKVGNQRDLEEYILYFYSNRAELTRMGRNARKAVEKVTLDNYCKRVNEVLTNVKKMK
jgi:glycosyltransferase involved in cell wall biosynthesis